MNLATGTRLGPYETISLIGEGAMGEVYRARDTRLGRDVAIKRSKTTFDERFQREALAIAALNHPNICTLHDIGPDYLVMEFVDGESLDERLARGPLAEAEALTIATQVAAALEAAHERGIVHRDLKPANIRLTPDGQVKVLDFGVAKLAQAATSSDETQLGTSSGGLVVGTPAYMAPEQARSQPVDARADIWSFGVVLWEMLTGRRPFVGETATDVIAAIITTDPPWDQAPARLQPLLRRCLAKDPRHRLRHIADARLWLEEVPAVGSGTPAAPRRSPVLVAAVAAAAAAIGLAGGWFVSRPRVVSLPPALQFSVDPQATAALPVLMRAEISPDGTAFAFAGASQTADTRVYVHSFQSNTTRPVGGPTGGEWPFWSPTGQSLAFRHGNRLMKVDVSGGEPVELSQVPGFNGGGDWSEGGTLLIALPDGLFRVPEGGGQPERVTTIDTARGELSHQYPRFLPDGRLFIFFIGHTDASKRGLYVGSLDDPSRRTFVVAADGKGAFVPATDVAAPMLVYANGDALMAQEFDAGAGAVRGAPVTLFSIARGAQTGALSASADFWVSRTGVLAFRDSELNVMRRLTWMNREGSRLSSVPHEDRYSSFFLSPDGRKVAIDVRGSDSAHDVMIYDFDRQVMSREVHRPGEDYLPQWSPDGQRLVFGSLRTGVSQLYVTTPGGSTEEPLTSDEFSKFPLQWTRDGRILFRLTGGRGGYDLWSIAIDGDRTPVPVVQNESAKFTGQVTADGKWIAYQSADADSTEVYVATLPFSGSTQQVSNKGGRWPKWVEHQGRLELFYVSTADMMTVVEFTRTDRGLMPSTPKELFRIQLPGELTSPYDVSADGTRLLVLEPAQTGPQRPLQVLTNWQSRLRP